MFVMGLDDAWHVIMDNGLGPLTALELYTLSLTSNEMREYYMRNVFTSCVFDVVEITRRSAYSVLQTLKHHQVHIPSHLHSHTTTTPDWAAQNGHVELLQWLLSHTSEKCTPFAMDLAALNGHLPILTWIHTNKAGGCTDLAADWAACRGHDGVLKWLYHHTASRCSAVATMVAAGRGDIAMLKWLCQQGVTCSIAAADWAFACGHPETLAWLETRGCVRTVRCDDTQTLTHMRRLAALYQQDGQEASAPPNDVKHVMSSRLIERTVRDNTCRVPTPHSHSQTPRATSRIT